MPKKKATPFPKRIAVVELIDGADDDSCLIASRDLTAPNADDGEQVAVYELVEIKTKRVTHELD